MQHYQKLVENLKEEASDNKTSGYYREECDRIAGFYDLGVRLLCLPFGGEKKFRIGLVDFIDPKKREWVLDVCCGTGTLSVMVTERVGSEGVVVGVDLSPNMIRVAKQKTKRFNVDFVLATAELLPFRENVFNKALCSFGLHEMTKVGRQNCLREVHKVLKNNGRLYVYDGSLSKNTFARFVERIVLKVYEGETAYNMIFKENLLEEIRKSGFELTRRKTFFLGALQMISARKV